jgi:hypothetical protein
MPGGGLFALVAYGAQNVNLSGNPDFTYFYKVYKKYSHFAEESVTFAMDGTQELSIDQPIQVRFKLQRVADLIRDLYFTFDIPDIYSKWIDTEGQRIARQSQYEFRWARFLGCALIQNFAFFIGGQKIQEFDGNYIIAKALADLDTDAFAKWQQLVGDVPDLVDPAFGNYPPYMPASTIPTTGVYPTVIPDPLGGNINRPSIPGRSISVPIPLWFSESTFRALPLVALQYMECEIQITLRPIQQLYQIRDINGNLVAPGYRMVPTLNQMNNPSYVQVSDASDVMIGNFLTDFGVPQPLIPTWPLQPRLQFTYVYLTDEERKKFATTPLQYIVNQVTAYQFPGLAQRQIVELYTHNPINRLILIPRRSDALPYRNDYANYTNWLTPYAPFLPPLTPIPPFSFYSTGRLIQTNGQQEILRTLRVLGDGNELQEIKPITYFQTNVPWKYLSGNPKTTGPIIYPFGLHSPNEQPDGSINSSRIKLFQVDLDIFPLALDTNYLFDVTVYVESLNWVTISSGTGGFQYAL